MNIIPNTQLTPVLKKPYNKNSYAFQEAKM